MAQWRRRGPKAAHFVEVAIFQHSKEYACPLLFARHTFSLILHPTLLLFFLKPLIIITFPKYLNLFQLITYATTPPLQIRCASSYLVFHLSPFSKCSVVPSYASNPSVHWSWMANGFYAHAQKIPRLLSPLILFILLSFPAFCWVLCLASQGTHRY